MSAGARGAGMHSVGGHGLAEHACRGRAPFPVAPPALARLQRATTERDGACGRTGDHGGWIGMDAGALLDRAGPAREGTLEAALSSVARPSMRDTIARRLAALIGSGALSVGDALPSERELASAMGVSRETIRSALTILSARGIVSVVHGARTTVASDEVGELGLPRVLPEAAGRGYGLDDIHEGRLLVEGHIAHLVAGRMRPDALDRLAGLIAAQERATGDPVRYLILDREFHALIYRACGNKVLGDLAVTLYSTLLDHRRRVVARPGAIARSIDDHRAILAALKARDGDAVAAAFGVHERRIYETTRQIMEEAGRSNNDTSMTSMGGPS